MTSVGENEEKTNTIQPPFLCFSHLHISVIEFDVVRACWCGGYGVDCYDVKGHHMQNVEAVIGMMVDLWLYGNCVATMMVKF